MKTGLSISAAPLRGRSQFQTQNTQPFCILKRHANVENAVTVHRQAAGPAGQGDTEFLRDSSGRGGQSRSLHARVGRRPRGEAPEWGGVRAKGSGRGKGAPSPEGLAGHDESVAGKVSE